MVASTNEKRYILLEVSESKAKELTDALSKRNYIKVIDLNKIDDRRRFQSCPICQEDLAGEWHVTVTEKILEGCFSILQKMQSFKSIVLYHNSFLSEVRPIDADRAIQFSSKQLLAAKLLGLVGYFKDGTQDTFYITDLGLKFFNGDVALTPSELTVVNHKVMESKNSMTVEEVKRKDIIKFNTLLTNIRKAIDNIPIEVLGFVRNGQTSLL